MTRMTRTIYYTATTLDGYLADENDSLSWLFVQDQDDHGPMNYQEFIAGIGSIAMGATTYEWIVEHQAKISEKWPYQVPAYVFTHRELAPIGDDIHFVSGEPTGLYDDIKAAAGDRDVWVVGGGDLAGQFAGGRAARRADPLDRPGDPRRGEAAVPAPLPARAHRARPEPRLRLCAVRRRRPGRLALVSGHEPPSSRPRPRGRGYRCFLRHRHRDRP